MGVSTVDGTETKIQKSIKKRRILIFLIGVLILLGILFNFAKLPLNMAGWFVPFKVELPNYVPLDVEKSYVKVVGFNSVKIVYENQNESLTTWATSEIGWNNVTSWDEKVTLDKGTTAYYNKTNDAQMISWRIDKIEYAIDYTGNKPLSKEELIKIASSIK